MPHFVGATGREGFGLGGSGLQGLGLGSGCLGRLVGVWGQTCLAPKHMLRSTVLVTKVGQEMSLHALITVPSRGVALPRATTTGNEGFFSKSDHQSSVLWRRFCVSVSLCSKDSRPAENPGSVPAKKSQKHQMSNE